VRERSAARSGVTQSKKALVHCRPPTDCSDQVGGRPREGNREPSVPQSFADRNYGVAGEGAAIGGAAGGGAAIEGAAIGDPAAAGAFFAFL